MMFFFFFFQAEDGIRDWSVTGVQTYALPISRAGRPGMEQQPGCRGGKACSWSFAGCQGGEIATASEIGRASCRERGEIWVGAGGVDKKKKDWNVTGDRAERR